MTRPELRPLTSVRGLFAWVVVLFHLRLACSSWLAPGIVAVLAKGYLAVDFFFLLSGFVIWLNYGAALAGGGRAVAIDFLVRRLARVWPLHAVMLAFALAIALVLLATGRPTWPLATLPLHLAMMQDWGSADALDWNDPAWSISAEWAAYLLAPIAALAMPRRRWPTAALILAAAVPLVALHLVMAGAGVPTLGADIARFGVLRCLAGFSCGAILSVVWARLRDDRLAEIASWGAASCAFAAWAAGAPETIAVPIGFACALLALAIGAERVRHPLGGRVIHYLGEISYATYLSHFLLFFAFKLAFVRDAAAVPPVLIASHLVLVLIASILLHHIVERPAQRTLVTRWKGRARWRPTPPRSSGSALR